MKKLLFLFFFFWVAVLHAQQTLPPELKGNWLKASDPSLCSD